jgi:ABC-type polysaccharide/polyol phosphate export permease
VVEGFRNVLVHGSAPDPALLAWSAASTLLVWLVAWPTFRYLSRYFADVL